MAKKISQDNPNGWRNPWVWGWIALVAIVLLVNITMISLAVITNPGLVSEDYYERGRDHERNINKKLAARNALGWTFNTDFPTSPVMNREEVYRFNTVDKHGLPITSGQATLTAYRPSDAKADFSVPMNEIVPGVYEGRLNFPLKGLWEVTVSFKQGENEYDFNRRANVLAQ
jgi:nitrogen fixation protein FixH